MAFVPVSAPTVLVIVLLATTCFEEICRYRLGYAARLHDDAHPSQAQKRNYRDTGNQTQRLVTKRID